MSSLSPTDQDLSNDITFSQFYNLVSLPPLSTHINTLGVQLNKYRTKTRNTQILSALVSVLPEVSAGTSLSFQLINL